MYAMKYFNEHKNQKNVAKIKIIVASQMFLKKTDCC